MPAPSKSQKPRRTGEPIMPGPQALKGVDKRGKPLQGLKNGKVSELSMFLKVKPGHEKAIREAIEAFCTSPKRDPTNPQAEKAAAQIGIHEVRLVLFDNDTRLIWLTSFDTDWDTYIDDTIAIVGTELYGSILKHTVEAPEGIDRPNIPNGANLVKDVFNAVRITAAGLLVTCANISIIEQLRNRDVRNAFDAALKNPGAGQALQH
ncbi:MAG: hypothetical protein ACXVBV_20190, partial [Isosphaeraceae bacterium]